MRRSVDAWRSSNGRLGGAGSAGIVCIEADLHSPPFGAGTPSSPRTRGPGRHQNVTCTSHNGGYNRGVRGRVFYGWVMVAVGFIAILIGAGTRAAPGALLLPIEYDTGWSTSQVTIAGSVGLLLLGLG